MLIGIGALVKKEFIQFFRDKFLFILVMYIFIGTLIYGPTLSLEVKNLPVGVYDLDRSPASRALIQDFQNVKSFNLKYYICSDDELDSLLVRGNISLGLAIPAGYEKKMAGGNPAQVQLIADGSNSLITTTALGYTSRLIRSVSRQVEFERLGLDDAAVSRLPGISNNIRALYDPELEFLNLGLLTVVTNAALVSGVFLALAAMIREKESGTMEQLMVTPVTPGKLILAKLLPMSVVQMLGLGTGLVDAILVF